MAGGAPNANGVGADADAPNILLLMFELSVVVDPKLNGFGASFVLAPNEKDALAAVDPMLLLPNGETLGGAELNALTLLAFALDAALNENGDLVSVGATGAGAPNGDAAFDAKLNADPELPNADGAVVVLFVPALNANGVFCWLIVGVANVELFAAGLIVEPNVKDEFVGVPSKIPPLDAVVVGTAAEPNANKPVVGAD